MSHHCALSESKLSLVTVFQRASSSSCHRMKSSPRSVWITSENHSPTNCTTDGDAEVWMITCRAYGFTTGLTHSGNAFISIWAPTPTSSPPLTRCYTWERSKVTTRNRTPTTRAICATAFSADTSTTGASTPLSSACALASWVSLLWKTFKKLFLGALVKSCTQGSVRVSQSAGQLQLRAARGRERAALHLTAWWCCCCPVQSGRHGARRGWGWGGMYQQGNYFDEVLQSKANQSSS